MNPVIQNDFSGGIDNFNDDFRIANNCYSLAFNVRNRTGSLLGINGPLKIDAPPGKKQGIFGVEQFLILFNNGSAYYKIVSDIDADWIRIEGFFMNPNVDYIYATAVPASTLNLLKVVDSSKVDGIVLNDNTGIKNITINGTAAGLLCQDGLNQPFLIKSDGSVLRTQSYSQWTADNRQYVPIGLNTVYHPNGITFVVSPDRKRIYRSVSGRPIDFVVNVDINGNKGGNAETVSYAVSNEDITCLAVLNSGELLVGTINGIYPLILNYDKVIFQEPTFLNNSSISAGITNQHSFVDILGDYAFIDKDGMRSFNAVFQLHNEGRNSLFSILINKLFTNISQNKLTAAFTFDNYAFFSVNTIYGSVVLIYDTTRQKWTSVDTLGVPSIKQFASAKQSANPRLYFITDRDVYQYFGSGQALQSQVRPRSIISGNLQNEIRLKNVRAAFDESIPNSIVSIQEISDGQVKSKIQEKLKGGTQGIAYPVIYPVKFKGGKVFENLNFNFVNRATLGYKIGIEVKWKDSSKLVQIQIETEDSTNLTSIRQQSGIYSSDKN